MSKTNILTIICLFLLIFSVFIISDSHIRSRINSHINAWRGRVMQAENIAVTFPEGETNLEMANILSGKIQNFNKNLFLEKTVHLQGYLFPDTYFLLPNSTPDDVVKSLSLNFNKKINSLKESIDKSKRSLSDIIIMASLIEAEAQNQDDAPIISGILWKRINLSMPLQVDATPITYTTSGLPKNPINNPGLSSIKAAITPTQTPYLFYLHDKDGIIHLARTFAEHQKNIAKYLR